MSRKGITWNELKELVHPSLSDEDIKVFKDLFGFLLVQYAPPNESQTGIGESFIFFKHASFKKAVKETIESIKNEQTKS